MPAFLPARQDHQPIPFQEKNVLQQSGKHSVRRFENLRCSAMAISVMTVFVGSFWLAGILF